MTVNWESPYFKQCILFDTFQFFSIWVVWRKGVSLALQYCTCAADAEIWAEQHLVAIPGWLLKYQNARLDHKGQLTSIKRPRLPIIKKNKAKRRAIYCKERGTRWRPKPSPTPQWRLWGQDLRIFIKTCGFVEKGGKFEANLQVASLGGTLADFP